MNMWVFEFFLYWVVESSRMITGHFFLEMSPCFVTGRYGNKMSIGKVCDVSLSEA